MIGKVSFKKRNMTFKFNMSVNAGVESACYALGSTLCDFTAVSPSISQKLFHVLRKKFVADISTRLDTPTIGAYVPFLRKALDTNPYLFIYLKFYAECLVHSCSRKDDLPLLLKKFISEQTAERNLSGIIALADPTQYAEWLGRILIDDMEFRRNRLKQQLSCIVTGNDGFQNYTPKQRFFILMHEADSGLDRRFKVNLSCDYGFQPNANLGTIKAALLESKTELCQEYEIDTPDDLISIELFKTVFYNLPVKICRCCGEFFVPPGRSDSEYCSRINPPEEKRCSQIGAMRTLNEKYSGNPVYAEYTRAYKRNHSRLRNGKLYEEEFKKWSAAARTARDEYIKNNKSASEYKDFLAQLEADMAQ